MINHSNNNSSIMMKYINVKENDNEYEIEYLREMELKYLGMNITYDIFSDTDKISIMYKCDNSIYLKKGKDVNLLAYFTHIKNIKTKKGDNMVILDMSTKNNEYKAVIFPKALENIEIKIEANKLYVISGRLELDNKESESFSITNIISFY